MPATRTAGLAAIAFALAVNIPYAMLLDRFRYDTILREPPEIVLATFAAGGPALILIWLMFALCALAFLPTAGLIGRAIRATGAPWSRLAESLGVAAALVQAIGLLRWVFVVPALAHAATTGPDATRQAAIVVYTALHQYGGVAIGEHLGQTLTAGWTVALALTLLRHRLAPAAFGWAGFAIAALWILGQTELLATVGVPVPVIPVTPLAFMAWEAWLLALGLLWTLRPARASAPATGW